MDMKLKLKPIKKVEVEINDQPIGVFDITSEWNGLVKLENSDGQVIIASDERTFIDKVFGSLLADDHCENNIMPVVKISPSLIPTEEN